MNRRQVAANTMGAILTTTTNATADIITTTTTTTNTATTPTTSALLNESRQLLLKQQLKLKLNINVSEMMDNIRRNVDETQQFSNTSNNGHDGRCDRARGRDILRGQANELRESLNKLDTVTTVPQLQQKFNQFNIIDEAAITTNTITTTASTKTCAAAAGAAAAAAAKTSSTTTSLSPSSSLVIKSLTKKQQQQKQQPQQEQQQKQQQHYQNTALAKFNRIIDNTVPVINTYNYQQHVAETLANGSQQHPHYQHERQQQLIEMPILSDSLKRRLANNHHQYCNTDLIVNNSKVNFSSTTTTTTVATTSKQTAAVASTPKAAATAGLAVLAAKSSSSQQDQESPETAVKMSLVEDERNESERNDVHYLLKQLNSFSDIEEIEIVDMKQKQRQLEQQHYNKQTSYNIQQNNQQQPQLHSVGETHEHSCEQKVTKLNFTEYQHVERVRQQYVDYVVDTARPLPQHASPDQLYVAAAPLQVSDQPHSEHHVEDAQQQVAVGMLAYTMESKQHYQTSSATSPTATSLVIYSPSSQSHKGIRRYASQDEHAVASYHPHHHSHYHPNRHRHSHSHHVHLPHEHCSEGSMLNSAAAQAAAAEPMILQQFVDDYIFQSSHYLEANNFVANYRTAMVESSSHEFRPSTTTTTRTSNEEFYEEEETGYIEDHSSAHSFELHETEPPTVICKAPAPLNGSRRSIASAHQQHHQSKQLYTMETRLCSSGVQTDFTASSLAQSFSLSSSLSSSEKRKRRQPLFKCCYTPLDRWREKRYLQQQRTKSAAAAFAGKEQQLQLQQITTKNTSVAAVGGPSYAGCNTAITLNSTLAAAATTTTTTTLVVKPQSSSSSPSSSSASHKQHHNQSLTKYNNKNNAPYAV